MTSTRSPGSNSPLIEAENSFLNNDNLPYSEPTFTQNLLQRLSHILLAPVLFLEKHFKFAKKTKSKISLFTLEFALLIILVVPSIFMLEYSILNDEERNIEIIRTEASFKKLKKLNTAKLAELVLPPYELIKNETLYMDPDYQHLFDPRLAAALWLENVKEHLEENNGFLDPTFKIRFSWNDWVDLKSKLVLPTKVIKDYKKNHHGDDNYILKDIPESEHNARLQRLSCEDMRILFPSGNHEEPFYLCENLREEEMQHIYTNYPHKFRYTGYSSVDMKVPGRIITSAAYLYTSAPPPARMVFLGAGVNGSAITIIPDTRPSSAHNANGYNLQYLRDYLSRESFLTGYSEREIYDQGLRVLDSINNLAASYNPDMSLQPYYFDSELQFDQSYLLKIDPNVEILSSIDLKKEDFMWDVSNVMNHLHEEVDGLKKEYFNDNKVKDSPFTIEDSLSSRLLNGMQYTLDHTDGNNFRKYLKEASTGDRRGDHFDYRFFSGLEHPDWDRQAVIHRMGRAYLRFCYSFGIRSWISYGTMLGWYRNGLSLPWDEDIDVVMTMDSMFKIAKFHNQSMIVDVTKQDKYGSGLGSYFLDLGSSYYSREKGNGANAIDGRFIDTASGTYIDLTAIAFTEFWSSHKVDGDMRKMIEPEYDQRKDDGRNREEYDRYLEAEVEKKYNDRLVYHCRNHNFYLLEEVSPLVPTFFEGVRTFVPHQYRKLLDRKYQGALDRDWEPGYHFKSHLRLWVDDYDCPDNNDKGGELCTSEDVVDEYRKTREYTERHSKAMKLEPAERYKLQLKQAEETVPMRFDKFLIEYAHSLNAEIE